MVSVFFRCNCPYVGYSLKKADYVNHIMAACDKSEITNTGYAFLHNSGSYMILASVEGKKYFHSRQTKSKAYDDQNRPVYTNIALVGSTGEDVLVISRIAGYALLDESGFYQEIAQMITLLDGDFTVDFAALQAFLKRFEKDYQVETSNPTVKELCKNVFFRNSRQEIDFIVLEADMPYFNKQLGRVFTTAYPFSYQEAVALASDARIVFPQAEPAVENEQPAAEPENQNEPKPEENALAALQEQCALLDTERQNALRTSTDLKQKLEGANRALTAVEGKLLRLKAMLNKHFWLGVAVGVIGTAFAVLIFKILR